MDRLQQEWRMESPRSGRGKFLTVAVALLLLGVLVALLWLVFVRAGPTGEPPDLVRVVGEPESGDAVTTLWSLPSAVAVDGDTVYILDTGNNRILVADDRAVVDDIICETGECAFLLDAPEDLEVRDGLIYVANTEQGRVDVVDFSGNVVRAYELPSGDGAPRASGVYVADDGSLYVSDRASGKIAVFEPGGSFQRYFGEDTVGVFEFVEPTGLTMDGDGNLYVTEYGQGRVVKISPEGRVLATFWMIPGAPTVSESTDVVVGDNGFVYMADDKRSVIHVFSESARYIGIVGLVDASRRDSPGALLDPWGLDLEGERLFIMDRTRGLVIFDLDPSFFAIEV